MLLTDLMQRLGGINLKTVAPSASLKSSLENGKVRLYYIRIARFTPPFPTGFKVSGAGGSRTRKTEDRQTTPNRLRLPLSPQPRV